MSKSRLLSRPGNKPKRQTIDIVTLPAPIAGWNTAESLASTSPATARVLDNWRPTTTGIMLRAGSQTHATISAAGAPVVSLMTFNTPLVKKLFAASVAAIFDVTTVADPLVAPAPSVSGQTSGYYSFVQFATSGGDYLTAVNGTDPLLLYNPIDGWTPITGASTPAITGIASTSALSFVWVYRSRQFFVEAGTLRARYLPVGSIAGALGTIELAGVFQKGGSLLFGATWSSDTGDGLDDKCVFVTTEGEAAIYEGSDPSTPGGFSLVGRYDIGPPLGPRATMRAGGDLVIATEEGLVPISDAVNKDASLISFASISRAISPDWQREAQARRALPWEVVKWPRMAYAIVSTPVTLPGQQPISFVVNTVTGAWCRYTNWDTRCLVLHNDQLYFGTNDGRVKLGEVGGDDDGAAIYSLAVGSPEHLKRRGRVKTIHQAHATFMSSTPFRGQLSASVDYVVSVPSPPGTTSGGAAAANEWDIGLWGSAAWDAASASETGIRAEWVSIGLTGYVMQYQLQITSALDRAPDTELVSIDVAYDTGATIV